MSHLVPEQWDMDEVLRCLHAASAEKLRCCQTFLKFIPIFNLLFIFQSRDAEWSPVMEFADFPWVPVIDGEFLVESVNSALKQGHFKRTQLLAGRY
jgi:hypothetical protein